MAHFRATAARLATAPEYIEKDFWVCAALDTMYHGLPDGHPRLLFKGGTSLSKAFGLINRFSEDVDITVFRHDLGFVNERDPVDSHPDLSNSKRRKLFDELRLTCGEYMRGALREDLQSAISAIDARCEVVVDKDDLDQQSLLIKYPSLYPNDPVAYVLPHVKIEGGARSALDPNIKCDVVPYLAEDVGDRDLSVTGITTILPSRTFWDKILILHGLHCGLRDEGRLPTKLNRISRHYYDVAMFADTATQIDAVRDQTLRADVVEHNLVAFRQKWKKLEEAIPGTTRIVPQAELQAQLEQDYVEMQHMFLGDAPSLDWIIERLQRIEDAINVVELMSPPPASPASGTPTSPWSVT